MSCEKVICSYLDQQAKVLLLDLDPGGAIRQANAFTSSFLGGDPSGRHVSEVFLDFSGDFDFAGCFHSGDRFLLNLPRNDGLPQTFHVQFLPHSKGFYAVGEINSDEIEMLRTELVRSNNELHNLTRELHKKTAELERLNELKNHFLGMAAHDLRNPLTAIMGYSEFMLTDTAGALKSEHLGFLNDIRYLSQFMLSLINDLLDISALESGKLQPKYEPGYLPDLLFRIVSVNRPFATRKEIELVLESRLPDEISLFDEHRLRQIMNNLISNAIKFSPRQTRVVVFAGREEDKLNLSVSDQGPGIPVEEQARLFHPFPNISVRSTDGEKSTGLGLAITKKIATSMRGQVWVESAAGAGSTFHCQLPWLCCEGPC
ncbi:MAG: HAMP domain-containing sensor histidine kinase [Syntrophotaleaceae bacterium]